MKNSKIILYSLPILGGGFMNFLIANFLLKYTTDVLLIAPAILGSILFTARIWDAINDPIVGHLSDNTRSQMGRRKSWIILSAPLLVLSFILVWVKPFDNSATAIIWLTTTLFVFFTLITALYVPHYSLGAELSNNYSERNKIFAIRSLVENFGVIIAIAFMAILEAHLKRINSLINYGNIIFALVFLFLILIFFKSTSEKKILSSKEKVKQNLFKSFTHVLKSKNTKRVLLATLCTQSASVLIAVMAPFYAPHVLGQKVGSIVVAVFMLGALASTLIWPMIGKRIEKKMIWQICTATLSIGFIYFLFASNFPLLITYIVCFVLGTFAGGVMVVLPSMIADCIDEDDQKYNERKEGIFYSVFTFVNKTGMGLASALAGFLLQYSAYDANVKVQSFETIFTIKIFYSLAPFLLFLCGFFLMKNYNLTKAKHQEILKNLF